MVDQFINYDTVILITHGSGGSFATGELFDLAAAARNGPGLFRGHLKLSRMVLPLLNQVRDSHISVGQQYLEYIAQVKQKHFAKNALVVAGSCSSYATGLYAPGALFPNQTQLSFGPLTSNLAKGFKAMGAGYFLGWTDLVYFNFIETEFLRLFSGLLFTGVSANTAFSTLGPFKQPNVTWTSLLANEPSMSETVGYAGIHNGSFEFPPDFWGPFGSLANGWNSFGDVSTGAASTAGVSPSAGGVVASIDMIRKDGNENAALLYQTFFMPSGTGSVQFDFRMFSDELDKLCNGWDGHSLLDVTINTDSFAASYILNTTSFCPKIDFNDPMKLGSSIVGTEPFSSLGSSGSEDTYFISGGQVVTGTIASYSIGDDSTVFPRAADLVTSSYQFPNSTCQAQSSYSFWDNKNMCSDNTFTQQSTGNTMGPYCTMPLSNAKKNDCVTRTSSAWITGSIPVTSDLEGQQVTLQFIGGNAGVLIDNVRLVPGLPGP